MPIDKKKEIIKRIIDDWDPINLFPEAPENEYWSEIDSIIMECSNLNAKEELAKVIKSVFINSFNEDIFRFSYEECLKIAEKIQVEIENL